MPFHVYILQSDKDQSFYIGHTSNLKERIARHNNGRSLYTKPRRPWRIVYSEEFASRPEAATREKELKSLHSKDCILRLINTSR